MWTLTSTLSEIPIPVLAAYATVSAAIVAAVMSFTVSIVNAWNADRLARRNAHREYRREMCRPIQEYSRSVERNVQRDVDVCIAMFETCATTFVLLSERKPPDFAATIAEFNGPVFLYCSDETVRSAVTLVRHVRNSFSDVLLHLGRFLDGEREVAADDDGFLYDYMIYVTEACALVERACEAFIYERSARKLTKSIDKLEDIREHFRASLRSGVMTPD